MRLLLWIGLVTGVEQAASVKSTGVCDRLRDRGGRGFMESGSLAGCQK